MSGTRSRNVGALIGSNLLGGVGVASGVAVGALLVEELGGDVVRRARPVRQHPGGPPSRRSRSPAAARRGRRQSLSTGYAIAVLGAVLILRASALGQLLVLIVGLGCFGVAQAVNLQSRYAAADDAPAASRARAMSIVVAATVRRVSTSVVLSVTPAVPIDPDRRAVEVPDDIAAALAAAGQPPASGMWVPHGGPVRLLFQLSGPDRVAAGQRLLDGVRHMGYQAELSFSP